jgi:hypothetical protein
LMLALTSTVVLDSGSLKTHDPVFLSQLWKSCQCPVGWSGKLLLVFARTVILGFGSCRVESYVTTNGHSASLSWNKAFIWGLQPDIYSYQTLAGLFMWGAPSDKRIGLLFTIAAGPRQRCHSQVQVPWDSWPYFTLRFETSLFFASYDSQGYSGSIWLPFHMGYNSCWVEWSLMTNGQSASQSVLKYRTYSQIFITVRQWSALSDERMDLSLTIGAGPRQHSHSLVRVCGTRDDILLSQIRDFPFRRPLWFAWLWWRYLDPPPHGIFWALSESKSHCDWRSVSQSVSQSVNKSQCLFITVWQLRSCSLIRHAGWKLCRNSERTWRWNHG